MSADTPGDEFGQACHSQPVKTAGRRLAEHFTILVYPFLIFSHDYSKNNSAVYRDLSQ
jgi:hypothetical protein